MYLYAQKVSVAISVGNCCYVHQTLHLPYMEFLRFTKFILAYVIAHTTNCYIFYLHKSAKFVKHCFVYLY